MAIAIHNTAWKPIIMLSINASTEPITVKNPFTPHAHAINAGACLFINCMPEGKGIPNKIPNGIINTTDNIILAVMGKAIAALNKDGRNKLASKSNDAKRMIAVRKTFLAFETYFPEIYAPKPVNNNNAASTMANV